MFFQYVFLGASQVALVVKNPPASAGDLRVVGSIPGSGRSPGEGHGNPFQYSRLENPLDRGIWWATVVQGVTKSRTWLRQLTTCISLLNNEMYLCPKEYMSSFLNYLFMSFFPLMYFKHFNRFMGKLYNKILLYCCTYLSCFILHNDLNYIEFLFHSITFPCSLPVLTHPTLTAAHPLGFLIILTLDTGI